MPRSIHLLVNVVVAAALLVPALAALGPRTALGAGPCTTGPVSHDAEEAYFLQLVNEARLAAGRAPLAASASLARTATWTAADLAGRPLSDTDSLGRSPLERAGDCGYAHATTPNTVVAAVLSRGNPTAGPIAYFLLHLNPGLATQLLDPRFTAAGVGRTLEGDWAIILASAFDAPLQTTSPALTVRARIPMLAR
jgi:uncharacterized protein YkwD